eukprot:CAMPEP_0119299522 /NCGR_PEP_ID=MMETSP1333-20130426/1600_1 /TAXON_ID=418940 /ORGANISM="Scyphosphaera apsteinii, Strain RCC1455" /LENGTH=30 /DNA_ID= /DNA_START= /DNA_END= /DNA_ORIENTATION=
MKVWTYEDAGKVRSGGNGMDCKRGDEGVRK